MSEATATGPQQNGKAAPSWARGNATKGTRWGQPDQSKRERATGRLRKTIEGLPDWEPLPPGEPVVRRTGRDA